MNEHESGYPYPTEPLDAAYLQTDEPRTEEYTPRIMKDDDEVIEDIPTFDLDSFQVVRREFFAHMAEPSISFCNYKIGLNAACIKRMPDTDYIQFLVNRETKTLAVRPCQESDLHSFQWCITSKGKRKPRQVTGKMFFMKIFTMMGWNPDYRYKILGKLIRANGQYLFVFDLTATEMYRRVVKEGEKTKTSRIPVFPAEWQDQFGVPFEQHRKSLQINIFDNFAVYGIRDKEAQPVPVEGVDPSKPEAPAQLDTEAPAPSSNQPSTSDHVPEGLIRPSGIPYYSPMSTSQQPSNGGDFRWQGT